LHIALRLCDLKPGSKVVSTPITFCSTNAVILYENHIPVFADVDRKTLSLSSDSVIKNVLEHDAGAVIWVHYSGYATKDFEDFVVWRNTVRPELKVIEDCAHAAGATYKSDMVLDGYSVLKDDVIRKVGSRNDTFSCNSFQAVKNLPTADSGTIQVPNEEYLDRAKKLSWLGIDKSTFNRTGSSGNELYKWKYDIEELGWKYNGNDIMAAIAIVQLKRLDVDNNKRRDNYRRYRMNIPELLVYQGENSSHHLCVALVDDRERVMSDLKAAGYAPGVHYLPNYEFPVFSRYYKKGSCEVTENVASSIITLPNHLLIENSDVDKICEIVRDSQKKSVG
jgi:dTDP-4-amino-4,6-dideoxygalactose transaminase